MKEHPQRRELPLQLISDEPIRDVVDDGLGLDNWARILADVCAGTMGPFTIGVFGGWGVGKTSVLECARRLVSDSKAHREGLVRTVKFDAWRFEREPDPLVPLAATILDSLKEVPRAPKDRWASLREALRALMASSSIKMAVKPPFAPDLELQLNGEKLSDRMNDLEDKWVRTRMRQMEGHRALETMRKTTDGTGIQKVIVFVDDLDRCMPENAIALMERIKIVLNEPGFIFVFAADYELFETSLSARYASQGVKDPIYAARYLDKFVQLPLWLPPHEERFQQLIGKLCERGPLEAERRELEALSGVIASACNHNPRQLVRFLNDLLVDRHVHRRWKIHSLPLGLFVVARGLRHRSESLYQALRHDDSMCRDLAKCSTVEAAVDYLKIAGKESEVARQLLANRSLIVLLVSHAGNSWLRKAALRKRVDNMLDEWRHFYQREHETLADAIAHLTAGTDVAPAAMRVHTSILPARMAAIAPLERLVDEPSLDPETREKVMDALRALNRSKEAQG